MSLRCCSGLFGRKPSTSHVGGAVAPRILVIVALICVMYLALAPAFSSDSEPVAGVLYMADEGSSLRWSPLGEGRRDIVVASLPKGTPGGWMSDVAVVHGIPHVYLSNGGSAGLYGREAGPVYDLALLPYPHLAKTSLLASYVHVWRGYTMEAIGERPLILSLGEGKSSPRGLAGTLRIRRGGKVIASFRDLEITSLRRVAWSGGDESVYLSCGTAEDALKPCPAPPVIYRMPLRHPALIPVTRGYSPVVADEAYALFFARTRKVSWVERQFSLFTFLFFPYLHRDTEQLVRRDLRTGEEAVVKLRRERRTMGQEFVDLRHVDALASGIICLTEDAITTASDWAFVDLRDCHVRRIDIKPDPQWVATYCLDYWGVSTENWHPSGGGKL